MAGILPARMVDVSATPSHLAHAHALDVLLRTRPAGYVHFVTQMPFSWPTQQQLATSPEGALCWQAYCRHGAGDAQ